MNRIERKMADLRATHRKMLSPYLTAGDPSPRNTVGLMHTLVEAGADLLELGLPFSDPMAEGPVIQAAMERALLHHVNCDMVFDMVAEFRQRDDTTPIVLMGYLNPVEMYGYERFAKRAKEVGIDGTILVDLPPEESVEVNAIWQLHDLYPIFLCSPTTSNERMALINEQAKGYLYYVSLKGVTGSGRLDLSQLKTHYEQRRTQTKLPLMVGFGIKTPEMAAAISEFADGVIVGAALIEKIAQAAEGEMNSAAFELINGLRVAIDNEFIGKA